MATATPRTDREVYKVTALDIGFKVVNPGLCRELERALQISNSLYYREGLAHGVAVGLVLAAMAAGLFAILH